MSVTVRIPGPLRKLTDGQGKLRSEPGTLRAILGSLAESHAGLQSRLFADSGELQPVVRVFVDETDIRSLDGLETEVAPGQMVSLVLPVAGA
jgi:molybdopterin synthase sulfur carrier subunit